MNAIVVDDQPIMLTEFAQLSSDIDDLEIVASFTDGAPALEYVRSHDVDVVFTDVRMPGMDGLEFVSQLRSMKRDILIVPVTAHESYLHEFNRIGVDYYVVKPYTKQVLEKMMERLRLLSVRLGKKVYIQTFGRFLVKKDGKPVPLTGKAKEILALVVMQRGKEVGNEEIYSTIWEGRPTDNASMSVYYNAIKRLRRSLESAGLEDLLVSTPRGQTVNTDLFDCDYYEWKDSAGDAQNSFEGKLLSEYYWSEYLIGEFYQ